MSRRMWFVVVDTDSTYIADRNWEGKYNPEKDNCGIFLQERHAMDAAKRMAQRFAGADVHVFEQKMGFISKPKPVETKIWNANGEFVPAP